MWRARAWFGAGLLALAAIGASCVVWSLWSSERVSAARVPELTVAQLRHLDENLEARADAMQGLFPEGRVFTLALYGAAWSDAATADSGVTATARQQCRRALSAVLNPRSLSPFGPAGGLPHGMFYEAWSNWLRVKCWQLEPNATERVRTDLAFTASCDRLERAVRERGPFVESYAGSAWPADTVVGVASLSWCAKWLGSPYADSVQRWLREAQGTLDPVTGLLPHSAETHDARGSSAALISAFLPEIDREFSRVHYGRFRSAFDTSLFGVLPAVLEYPPGREGQADVDSGPLIQGVSGPATIVAIAAARAHGDLATALALRRAAETIGLPLEWRGKRSYGLALLPVGEAFLAWSSAILPRATGPAQVPTVSEHRARFRWLCAVSLLGCAALVACSHKLRRSELRPSVSGREI